MDPCQLDKRFEQVSALGPADVVTLYVGYDSQVEKHPECANTDIYLKLYQALERTRQGATASKALGMAYFSSTRMQVRHAGNRMVFNKLWEQSTHDTAAVLAQISVNQAEVPLPPRIKDWREMGGATDRRGIDEFDASVPQLYHRLRSYLNQSLYAKYYNGTNVNITLWLVDVLAVAAWQKDPTILLDVVDFFIDTQKLKLSREQDDDRGNMLIVLRDLLRLTFDAKEGGVFPLSDANLSHYFGAGKWTLPGVDLGVGAYMQFINRIPKAALPDAALMKQLIKMTDNKNLAREVELKVIAREKAAGRKK